MTFKTLLEETLEAWEDARTGLIDEVANVPDRDFEFRPAEEVRSVRELVVHILEVAMMMTGELTRGDTDFHRAEWPVLLAQYTGDLYRLKTKRELVDRLETQFSEARSRFLDVGELHMLQLIVRFDGEMGSRLAWLQHGIAQEMYHRGQIALYERLLGIEPALTRRIRGT